MSDPSNPIQSKAGMTVDPVFVPAAAVPKTNTSVAPTAPTMPNDLPGLIVLIASLAVTVSTLAQGQNVTPRPALIKICEPRMFSGKAKDNDPCLNDIEEYMLFNTALTTDDVKMRFIRCYMSNGSLMNWWILVKTHNTHLLHSVNDLVDAFRKHFGNANIKDTQLKKLENLCQGSHPAAKYIAEFYGITQYLHLSEQTKMVYFIRGNSEVKDALVSTTKPESVTKYEADVIRIDNHVFNRRCKLAKEKRDQKDRSRAKL